MKEADLKIGETEEAFKTIDSSLMTDPADLVEVTEEVEAEVLSMTVISIAMIDNSRETIEASKEAVIVDSIEALIEALIGTDAISVAVMEGTILVVVTEGRQCLKILKNSKNRLLKSWLKVKPEILYSVAPDPEMNANMLSVAAKSQKGRTQVMAK